MDERYCPGCADPGCHTCVTIRYMAGPEDAAYHTPRLRYGETHDSYRDRRQDEEDQAWDTLISLRLVPHPHLNAAQAQLVRDEYMAGTVARIFEVRLPVSKYLVQAYRAAIDTSRQLPPDFILAVQKPSELPSGALL